MLKPLTFLVSLVPFAYVLWQVYLLQTGAPNSLSADPGKEILLHQGEWAIRFLLITLLITPLRQLTGWNSLQKIRRMLGLFAFFYASTHLLAYVVFLLELDFANLTADIQKRPYITVGFAAYLLLVPLVITSTNRMMRKLRKNWVLLHRAIYGIGILAVTHVAWLAKSSYADAVAYGAIVVLLLFLRVFEPKFGLFRQALKPAS
ncbi:MAG: sulfoxide reductase heme-binding subunit YedZ [Pseudomonadales bacterium]|nr:sulfoxide reductase heme-binding subunit YedZ [Pseudomonadales bacterium]MBO6658488.1 sulfoxide reductase heme-binding subunit YedZ [Pseudomonadales bacterium]MBO6704384.1 sulfoxide reductase heme-binding subunit YedZ [Pseudomonadales bacterium]MBO7007595.1 sulfoxide reductase heme-binding subunit YedZ [Pseudomonadales bacterium]